MTHKLTVGLLSPGLLSAGSFAVFDDVESHPSSSHGKANSHGGPKNAAASTSSPVRLGIAERNPDNDANKSPLDSLAYIAASMSKCEMPPPPMSPHGGRFYDSNEYGGVELLQNVQKRSLKKKSKAAKATKEDNLSSPPLFINTSGEDLSPSNSVKPLQCNCKRTRCLKMYCDCFRFKKYCTAICNCGECANVPEHEDIRQAAIESIVGRNPEAFKPKVRPGVILTRNGHNLTRILTQRSQSRVRKSEKKSTLLGVTASDLHV